jgi:hypothetical protein
MMNYGFLSDNVTFGGSEPFANHGLMKRKTLGQLSVF